MKLSELIKRLQEALKEKGDLEMAMSSDAEGNSYHGVDDVYLEQSDDSNPLLVIYPDDNYLE